MKATTRLQLEIRSKKSCSDLSFFLSQTYISSLSSFSELCLFSSVFNQSLRHSLNVSTYTLMLSSSKAFTFISAGEFSASSTENPSSDYDLFDSSSKLLYSEGVSICRVRRCSSDTLITNLQSNFFESLSLIKLIFS